ncbi:hypothetical protein GA0074692_1045 [Micromonospora pallida]|uniref:Secreted protein n=1 Tax=Micromonospora pallida TaxID=145854 RepID=A0A1C6RUY7_9ACTN|nr:hypothetical protein [Micromonospora pallida]SCL20975.1 hypothetical protein GA0074692_1045 [Micromonospora pallida]
MRISIMTGLALAGAAAAVAVAGGVAYATDDADHEAVVQIVTEQEQAGSSGAGQRWSTEDCPDKDDAAPTAPGGSETGQPTTPQESAAPQEAL